MANQTIADVRTSNLPTRTEKRIVPFIGDASSDPTDYEVLGALQTFYDHVLIRVPSRGRDAQGNALPSQSLFYRFLINPAQVSISKQTVDASSFTRGGWQIGVWGKDFVSISLSGKTPGRYFTRGLTDYFPEYTVSWRNLSDLEMLVENNGCWFEGEQLNPTALSAASLRSRIKMHQDIELTVGEFVWSGMFEELTISEDAESPFLADFSLSFTAWRERYRSVTPYPSPIANNGQRGHAASKAAIAASTSAGALMISTASSIGANDLTPSSAGAQLNAVQNPAGSIYNS